ncbi:hypothetical protein C8J56DRAFT_900005 [Mycena floridula]|nr:hypothetical protein C8J56DRAFT_900005 [Mycena floridula]
MVTAIISPSFAPAKESQSEPVPDHRAPNPFQQIAGHIASEIEFKPSRSLLSTSVKSEHRRTSIFYRFGLEEKGATEDLGTLAVVAISVHLNSSSPEKGPKAGSNRKGKAPKSGNQLHSFTTLKLHETLCRYRRIIERRNNVARFKSTFVSLGESITMKERRATRMDEHERASPLTRSRQASGKLELRYATFTSPLAVSGTQCPFGLDLTLERIDDCNLMKQKTREKSEKKANPCLGGKPGKTDSTGISLTNQRWPSSQTESPDWDKAAISSDLVA